MIRKEVVATCKDAQITPSFTGEQRINRGGHVSIIGPMNAETEPTILALTDGYRRVIRIDEYAIV